MAKYLSALESNYKKGFFGKKDQVGLIFQEFKGLEIYQIAAWPNTLHNVGLEISNLFKFTNYPEANKAYNVKDIAILRVEPLKWWVIRIGSFEKNNLLKKNSDLEELFKKNIDFKKSEKGTILSLTNSRIHLRINGKSAVDLLNRHISIDLREKSFPVNSLATTNLHHCGVTLWRSNKGYELFLPVGFALSLWNILLESATQFGYEIK